MTIQNHKLLLGPHTYSQMFASLGAKCGVALARLELNFPPSARRTKLMRTSTQLVTMRHAVMPRWLGGNLELDCKWQYGASALYRKAEKVNKVWKTYDAIADIRSAYGYNRCENFGSDHSKPSTKTCRTAWCGDKYRHPVGSEVAHKFCGQKHDCVAQQQHCVRRRLRVRAPAAAPRSMLQCTGCT